MYEQQTKIDTVECFRGSLSFTWPGLELELINILNLCDVPTHPPSENFLPT